MSHRRFRTPIALLFLLFAGGCSPQVEQPQVQPVPTAIVADDRPLTVSRNPDYRQAADLFSRKQYAGAEKTIETLLARPQLSESDRTFLVRQRDICRAARTGRKPVQTADVPRKR